MNSQAKHRRDLHGPPPSAKERRELADLFDDQGTAVRELLSGDEDARGHGAAARRAGAAVTARRLSVLDWRTLEIELEAARADVERELAEDGDALPPATAAAFAEVARVVRLSLAREAALQALEHKQNATQGAA